MPVNQELLSRLLSQFPEDPPVLKDVQVYSNWIIAETERYAISTIFRLFSTGSNFDEDTYLGNQIGRPVAEIAWEYSKLKDPIRMALVMASINASLPLPEGLFEDNAVNPLSEIGKDAKTCFIGHFQEAEIMREQGCDVTIIELFPRKGDVHWNDSAPVLKEAEVVFITGLTLINDTFLEVLSRTPNAKYRVLMGPTVPCSPVLFEFGIDLIGSTLIEDPELTARYCRAGGMSVKYAYPGALKKVCLTNNPTLIKERTVYVAD